MLPRAKDIRVVRQWAGYYDMTPDAAPILGETDVKEFWHATGFSGHGFMLGPVARQIMTHFWSERNTSDRPYDNGLPQVRTRRTHSRAERSLRRSNKVLSGRVV